MSTGTASAFDIAALRKPVQSDNRHTPSGISGFPLSLREQEVLELAHLDNGMIARMLGISRGTVRATLAKVYIKLGAENRLAAYKIYLQMIEIRKAG